MNILSMVEKVVKKKNTQRIVRGTNREIEIERERRPRWQMWRKESQDGRCNLLEDDVME